MKPESPVIPGRDEVVFAKDQPEYMPLPSIRLDTRQGEVITRWKPSIEELALLNKGESIYLHLWTFGSPLQPILMEVDTSDNVALRLSVPHAVRYTELKQEDIALNPSK